MITPNYDAFDIASNAQRIRLLIRSMLLDVRTSIPCEVLAVYPGTGTPPSIGTVDLQPLIKTVMADGTLQPVPPVYGAPFSRIQSGGTAIVIDPAVGDIGWASAADRDISSFLASGQMSGPGSGRKHNLADLVYEFSIISAAAITQYILANSSGITLLSPNTITIQGNQINLVGPVAQTNGNMTAQTKITVPTLDATTDVVVPNGSVNSHVHTGVTTGSGSTGPMTG